MCFLECFWAFFWCLEERKNVERNWEESKFQKKNVCPPVWGVPGSIYTPEHENRGGGH